MATSSASSNLEEARRQANLRLLQRSVSREIVDIVLSATHVVLYEFVNAAWKKCNVEGSLFLVSPFQLVILNRNSADNFQMYISNHLKLQDQDPYLIFKEQHAGEEVTRIRGIWFHNSEERHAMATALKQAIDQLQDVPAAVTSTGPHQPATAATAPIASQPTTTIGSALPATVLGHPVQPQQTTAPSIHQQQQQQQHDAASALASLLSPMMTISSAAPATVPAAAAPTLPVTINTTANPTDMAVLSNPTATATALVDAQAHPMHATTAVPQAVAATAAAGTPLRPTSSHSSLGSAGSGIGGPGGGVALDKKSLQLALLSLIQDDRFLDLLHSQYLRVQHARAKKQQQQQQQQNSGHDQNHP